MVLYRSLLGNYMVKIKIYKAAKIGMVLLTIDKAIVISTFFYILSLEMNNNVITHGCIWHDGNCVTLKICDFIMASNWGSLLLLHKLWCKSEHFNLSRHINWRKQSNLKNFLRFEHNKLLIHDTCRGIGVDDYKFYGVCFLGFN